MDHLRVLAETHGCFTRADALEAGYDDNAIHRAVRAKLFTRIRHGLYTFTDMASTWDEVQRHLVTARAIARRLTPHVALSHASAALDSGMELWDVDLGTVHLTRLDGGAGRTEAGVQHHEGLSLDTDVTQRDGYLVMKPTRAALETALLTSSEAAVCLLDSGLHRKLFTTEELEEAFALLQHWPGALHLQFAVRFADGRAESIGESRSRMFCYRQGLPAPDLQHPVYDASGRHLGTTDLAWLEYGLLGEFDGKVKYGRLLRPGEEPGDAVFREKVREDLIREATDCRMVRIVWADLYRPEATAARIRGLMRRPAA